MPALEVEHLQLSRAVADAVKLLSVQEMPYEACGVIGEQEDGEQWCAALDNVAPMDERLVAAMADPDATMRLWQYMEDTGARPLAYWHSHPLQAAIPSMRDRANGDYLLQLIYSVKLDSLRVWKIQGTEAVELRVVVL